ncbi:MAG: hypothetical protein AAGJ28_17540 [Pseudomonadota bacterium]
MWLRSLTGFSALGLYAWRVHDPKGSYAAFFDASDWITSFIIEAERVFGYFRNLVNIVMVDQADEFLLGMAVMALISVVFWPFRICGRWTGRKLKAILQSENKQRDSQAERGGHQSTIPPAPF